MGNTVERAFELARSGRFTTLDSIRDQLKRERSDQIELHLSGRLIKEQLRRVLAEVGAPLAPPEGEDA